MILVVYIAPLRINAPFTERSMDMVASIVPYSKKKKKNDKAIRSVDESIRFDL